MKTSAKMVLAAGALVAASALGYGIGLTQENQPHMQNALSDLKLARGELQVALHNKNGHRVNALNLTNQAIDEVQAGISAGDN
jgi:hypothetical protein